VNRRTSPQAGAPGQPAHQFGVALDGIEATHFPPDSSVAPSIAVALSGGLDSIILLHLAAAHARARGWTLAAFHVHHGISPHADAWRAHCAEAAQAVGAVFDARSVSVDKVDKGREGLEAAARKLRYAALGEMCRAHGATLLLTAHHLDDQAETILLQLLRGSGVAGLSGMDAVNHAPGLLGDAALLIARPLLGVPRASLAALAQAEDWAWVEDESNLDTRYARNALRHDVMPALAQAFPGFQQRLARSCRHVRAARGLLDEMAAQDLAHCLDREHDALVLERVGALSRDRVDNLLRHWMAERGFAMPSTAWLEQMIDQLLTARDDAQPLVAHPSCDVRRHRGRLYLVPKQPELAGLRDPDDEGIIDHPAQAFRWSGETSLAFPDYGGVLHFEPAEDGFDPEWLRAGPLEIDFRKGGERLKLAPNRPTRSLKAHFQSSGVPVWERNRLPIVSRNRVLLYAAGLGMDCQHVAGGPGRVALRWVPAAPN
jgi:tRNA(Ile)-lysidine synthase